MVAVVSTLAGGLNGTNVGFADGGALTQAQFYSPQHAIVDVAGNVLVADDYNQRVRLIAPSGGTRFPLFALGFEFLSMLRLCLNSGDDAGRERLFVVNRFYHPHRLGRRPGQQRLAECTDLFGARWPRQRRGGRLRQQPHSPAVGRGRYSSLRRHCICDGMSVSGFLCSPPCVLWSVVSSCALGSFGAVCSACPGGSFCPAGMLLHSSS